MRNPHFDDGLIRWSDEYSGRYEPPPGYDKEFAQQWGLVLENRKGFIDTPADPDEKHVDDAIYTITGKNPSNPNGYHDPRMKVRVLDHVIDPALIRGKDCADAGCGSGRWTRAMLKLGAKSVTSFDATPTGVASVKRFNPNAFQANIMTLDKDHPEWKEKFDFITYWGVAQSTHDPLIAFKNVADLVKPGGALFLAVYAVGGIQDLPITNVMRKIYHGLKTPEEKLRFVEIVSDRKWDARLPLSENLRNVARNMLGRPMPVPIGILDKFTALYNWTIPYDVVEGWFKKAGFKTLINLNEFENPKPHSQVLGIK